ncbi:MAG: CoB--CoM heterodisulfide reductase iron-sulfur subunit B family protein [Candidatus Bathyarchaeia archaeon]
MGNEFALFVGCTTLARLGAYEISARKVAEDLGVELVDMDGAGCCGTTFMESIDRKTGLAMAARNICIAEEMGLDIVALCNGCAEVLTKANRTLKEEEGLRDEINEVLAGANREFKGTVEVKHLVRMLVEDVGVDEIGGLIKRPFKGLKAAVHPGCHLIRPHEVMRFDDPEVPIYFDSLVNVTGAVSVNYPNKLECCAAAVLAIREELAYNIALEKVATVKKYADIMVTSCPFCYLQYEMSQLTASESYDVPVIHLPQLLGLALGLGYDELALYENRIDPSRIMNFL